MKVLNFYIISKPSKLVQKIVDYLIDSGHHVLLKLEETQHREEWTNRYTHNFILLADNFRNDKKNSQELPLVLRNIDYIIDFYGQNNNLDFPKMIVDASIKNKIFEVDVLLLIGEKAAKLASNGANFINQDHDNNLIFFCEQVVEALIDGIIHLSKYGQGNLTFSKSSLKYPICELIDFEILSNSLKRYYQALNNDDELFILKNEATELSSSNNVFHLNFSLDSKKCKDRNLHLFLEVLILYTLSLLNARQTSKLGYRLASDGKIISKFIKVDENTSYDDLLNQFKDPTYSIISSQYYWTDPLELSAIQPTTTLSWGPHEEAPRSLISFNVDPSLNTLQICCPKSLIFLEQFNDLFDEFEAKIKNFTEGKLNFGELLDTQRCHQAWINTLNDTEIEFESEQTLISLFERQVKNNSSKIALNFHGDEWSYFQLNEKANQLACLMVTKYQIKPGDLVALYMERNTLLIASMLAILKSGAAYIPLDLKYPEDRIKKILLDSQCKLVLTQDSTRCLIETALSSLPCTIANPKNEVIVPDLSINVLVLDTNGCEEEYHSLSHSNLNIEYSATDFAYVIYTSGTTGQPKGVAIEHRSLINILTSIAKTIEFQATDCVLAVTTIAFDISTLEIFMPLIFGGRIVLADQEDLLNTQKLIALIENNNVTIAQATPSLWQLIAQDLKSHRLNIKVLCGGEALPSSLARDLLHCSNRVWNVYGPTETTVWSTILEINDHTIQDPVVPIGYPIANTQCYILDKKQRLLPRGVIGELFIGGQGVARGYFNSDDLTKQKFIKNPFQTTLECAKGICDRLYKTGDLARWGKDGCLEFLGRNDFQVKIRGHRIELEDIESILKDFPGIEQCLVWVKQSKQPENTEHTNQFLVGYYIAKKLLDPQQIKEFLKSRLPEYMIPSFFVHLSVFPMTLNGKLDRKRLPDPDITVEMRVQIPKDELERQLCKIWAEVLNLGSDYANMLDDFFALGGNSITAIRLVNKINGTFQANLKISDIFSQRTVERLALLVKETSGQFLYKDFVITELKPEEKYKPFPLSNVQQTYFLGRSSSFELGNTSTHIYTEYQFGHLDVERLEVAFNILLSRHLALRTIFVNDEQHYVPNIPNYKIECYQFNNEAELIRMRDKFSHKIYPPGQYPLFDIFVSQFMGICILHISFDAIIIDMGSFEILFKEWIQLYQHPEKSLPELAVDYRNYVLQYEKIRCSELYLKAQEYWKSKLDQYNFEMNLPLKMSASNVTHPRFNRISKTIKKSVWDRIKLKAEARNISLTAVILEIYSQCMVCWSGQDNLCVNLTLFNRLPLHPHMNDVIGDFTVLELFCYHAKDSFTLSKRFQQTHHDLLLDIENNFFDGIDFQRIVKQNKKLSPHQILAPVVLTSVLGDADQGGLFNLPMNDTYLGIGYSISQTSQVWLDNKAYETNLGFVAEWDYVEQLFEDSIIENMHSSYCYLIECIADLDWDKDLFPIIQLTEQDRKLIFDANSEEQILSEDTLFSRIERYVKEKKLGKRLALTDSEAFQSYSYDQLLKETEAFTVHLMDLKSDDQDNRPLIGVLCEKGYSQVISTLSIMKSGHGYLPLHVEWPVFRIVEVLKQGGVKWLLLTRNQYSNETARSILASEFRLLVVEDILETIRNPSLQSSLEKAELPSVKALDIAYVIFTSGSTGKPKGVTISHQSVLNTIDAVNNQFNIGSDDKVFALSELSFDLSVYDIFGILAVGGQIIFPKQSETKEPKHWLQLIQEHKVTVWNSVPQLASLLVDQSLGSPELSSLRLYLLSGDWIPLTLPDRIKQQSPDAIVMSLGGATEGSIWSIWHEIKVVNPNWTSIPYGMAMPNQKMYVLNKFLEHCSVGVLGEIYIGGLGVALNYWGEPTLTNERFILHPLLGRLYKTGDLGRWHQDGYIEFKGRNDFQVKLNGYRVELEEISVKINQLAGIESAVVKIQNVEGIDHVIAYLLPENEIHKLSKTDQDKADFLAKQLSLQNDKKVCHTLQPKFDLFKFKIRKSYRQYLNESLEVSTLSQGIQKVLSKMNLFPFSASNKLNKNSLTQILSTISGLSFEGKALAKYRYPSGGGSYPIKSYVVINQPIEELNLGYYYYHPLNYTLCESSSNFHIISEAVAKAEIHLVIHWPAIEPLYQTMSERLAFIEAGHMLSLLCAELNEQGLHYQLNSTRLDLDTENSLAVRILIGTETTRSDLPSIYTRLMLKNCEDGSFSEPNRRSSYFPANTVFDQSSDLSFVLKKCQALLSIEGEDTSAHWLASGFLAQLLSEEFIFKNIGSCMLGAKPFANTLYSIALGKITEGQKAELESVALQPTLEEVIKQHLSQKLPPYMIPNTYVVLDAFPLTTNGKLDANNLPAIQVRHATTPPATEAEKKLAKVWGTFLNVSESVIAIEDNFFKLGGNSLTAMQLVRRLNHEFDLELKLVDLYRYSTIRDFLNQFTIQQKVGIREEGVI